LSCLCPCLPPSCRSLPFSPLPTLCYARRVFSRFGKIIFSKIISTPVPPFSSSFLLERSGLPILFCFFPYPPSLPCLEERGSYLFVACLSPFISDFPSPPPGPRTSGHSFFFWRDNPPLLFSPLLNFCAFSENGQISRRRFPLNDSLPLPHSTGPERLSFTDPPSPHSNVPPNRRV